MRAIKLCLQKKFRGFEIISQVCSSKRHLCFFLTTEVVTENTVEGDSRLYGTNILCEHYNLIILICAEDISWVCSELVKNTYSVHILYVLQTNIKMQASCRLRTN